MSNAHFSMFLSYLLRHHPEELGLSMDLHGWVDTDQLIRAINDQGRFSVDLAYLYRVAAEDAKGRYRITEDGSRIKACQGHSIPWVQPELTAKAPPAILYHGTTREHYRGILQTGEISRMERHAVHMTEDIFLAWKSAKRWKQNPVILRIRSGEMHRDQFSFGVSENAVWCTERVPAAYLEKPLYELPKSKND